jgi:hypothetical protein
MATRQTRLVIKNNTVPNAPFSGTTLFKGEAIVNTADGILMFSGITSSTSEWTPAGTGGNASFFEVGSNLYDLRLRNKITKYEGQTGSALAGKFLSGTTNGFVLADISDIQGVDTYVTGGTISYIGSNGTITLTRNDNVNVTITGITDIYTTGSTLIGSTAYFNTNDSLSAYTLDLSSFIPTGDTFVTGFTYTPVSNTFTISQDGGPTLTAQINSVSGLSISNLTAGRVVYVGTGDLLTDESGFEYNDGLNLLTVGNVNIQNPSGATANIGQGGLVIGSGGSLSTPGIGDLTVHGNLTVFGAETIVATTELYIEDPQITLNYNPTGSTTITSVSSGIRIQDGNGIVSGDTYFTIGQMQNLTSGDTSEYTGLTGYNNRGWVTQLNDIVIRNTNLNEGSPDGVRVLAEFDTLDGGQY